VKAYLTSPTGDFDQDGELPPNADDLTRDLELTTVLNVMGGGNDLVRRVCEVALLSGGCDAELIAYRQEVLADCLEHAEAVSEMFAIADGAIEAERQFVFGLLFRSPEGVPHRSIKVLELYSEYLAKLRRCFDDHATGFRSRGFTRLFATAASELDDRYFELVRSELRELEFKRGLLMSASLGRHNQGVGYVLHRPATRDWRDRLFGDRKTTRSFRIADRDENGFRMLGELRSRGVISVARATAQSAGHVLGFFTSLRAELGFYLGCINLHRALEARGQPTCFPVASNTESGWACRGLYDPSLALTAPGEIVGNEVTGDGRSLVMITGANQGGKSTFLRSVGVAQLMMQCGMFVGAEAFSARLHPRVHTHFKREEDSSMQSGKLDEELRRMRGMADQLTAADMVLFNEAFASTNEREGSEIALQIIRALHDAGVAVFFVTHMFDLSRRVLADAELRPLFLRAERATDGQPRYRLIEAEALPTSFGGDTYRRVFGEVDNGSVSAVLLTANDSAQ
jgi:hypothetical protein